MCEYVNYKGSLCVFTETVIPRPDVLRLRCEFFVRHCKIDVISTDIDTVTLAKDMVQSGWDLPPVANYSGCQLYGPSTFRFQANRARSHIPFGIS